MKLPLRRLLNACYATATEQGANYACVNLLYRIILKQITDSRLFGEMSSSHCYATRSEVMIEFHHQFRLEFAFPIWSASEGALDFETEWAGVLPLVVQLEQEHIPLHFWEWQDRVVAAAPVVV